jgi:hypothetical protein
MTKPICSIGSSPLRLLLICRSFKSRPASPAPTVKAEACSTVVAGWRHDNRPLIISIYVGLTIGARDRMAIPSAVRSIGRVSAPS